MERVSVTDVDPVPVGEASERRGLADALETTNLALNQYRLAAGEGLPGGLHAHMDQEEVFVVLEGEAIFETLDGELSVPEGNIIRFAPGEFQSGRNAGESPLIVLALGAPRETEDMRIPMACPDCDHENLRLDTVDLLTFVCPGCDATHEPRDCPDCGHETLKITLDDRTRPVVLCPRCDATFESIPLQT